MVKNMERLNNKICLITGGAKGIGKETAKLFKQQNAKVIITDINKEEGEKTAKELQIKFIESDASCENSWEEIIKEIENSYGKLDVLFNNAGILGISDEFGPQDPENQSLKTWKKIHNINLDSVFLGCKYAIKLMKKHGGGSIINMSSRSGLVGIPNTSAYASSKAAIRNHTKSVALYCAQNNYNIRCNSIHPAAILTDIWKPIINNDIKQKQKICAGIPLGIMGEPIDVANTVLFLASDESKFITGTEITIDGGILAGCTSAPSKE